MKITSYSHISKTTLILIRACMYNSNVNNKSRNLIELRRLNLKVEYTVIVSNLIKIFFS